MCRCAKPFHIYRENRFVCVVIVDIVTDNNNIFSSWIHVGWLCRLHLPVVCRSTRKDDLADVSVFVWGLFLWIYLNSFGVNCLCIVAIVSLYCHIIIKNVKFCLRKKYIWFKKKRKKEKDLHISIKWSHFFFLFQAKHSSLQTQLCKGFRSRRIRTKG